MLRARDEHGGAVLATAAHRKGAYFCPECGEQLVVKAGAVVAAHFAHSAGSACRYGEGEGARHLQMKTQIGERFRCLPEQYEVRLVHGHRADVVLYAQRTVVECQASPISIPAWETRTRAYNRCGYAVLWLWDLTRICKPERTLAIWRQREEAFERAWKEWGEGEFASPEAFGNRERRVPAEIRYCHGLSFGRVYVLDEAGEVAACHLFPPSARESTWFDADAREERDSSYTPKTLRVPDFAPVPGRITPTRSKSGIVVAGLGEGVWWQR